MYGGVGGLSDGESYPECASLVWLLGLLFRLFSDVRFFTRFLSNQ